MFVADEKRMRTQITMVESKIRAKISNIKKEKGAKYERYNVESLKNERKSEDYIKNTRSGY